MEGLPIGNGHLAAMVVNGERTERLALNHEWLWRSTHKERRPERAAEKLEELRTMLREEKFFEATAYANLFWGGKGGASGLPGRVDPYLPAGDLLFRFEEDNLLRYRELDMHTGVVKCNRGDQDAGVCTEAFTHCEKAQILYRIRGQRTFSLEMELTGMIERCRLTYAVGHNELRMYGHLDCGQRFCVRVQYETDGMISETGRGARILNASWLTAVIKIGVGETLEEIELEDLWDFEREIKRHCDRFARYMDTVQLALDDETDDDIPTDMRILAAKSGKMDLQLCQLYFHFGRYLLFSSSLLGELPANLQGKWNEEINPPWECDYHLDINLQMNYWMAEACGMGQCAQKLLNYAERMKESGRFAAAELYGCGGIYFPLQCDAWAKATPESYGWAVWNGAAAWLGQHFWKHYQYSGDREFLKNEGYPFLKDAAAFFEDFLIADSEGVLQFMPSQSPENRFEGTGTFPVSIGISAAMDVELVHELLSNAAEAAEVLGVDSESVEKWKTMCGRLPKLQCDSDGRLLEWERERSEVEPGHRHLSHLYGLYPGELFMQREFKLQYEGAVQALKNRTESGGGHTGWSRAWTACLFARIGDGEGFYEHFTALLQDFATSSLLDLHPPGVFQIDGNLGAVAAVIEALAGYWNGEVHLLRALPRMWSNGSLKGIRVPGGHILEMRWTDGRLVSLAVVLGFAGKVRFAEAPGLSECVVKGLSGERYILL